MTAPIASYQWFRATYPRNCFCPRHGAVTKWHGCPITWPQVLGGILDATKGVVR